MKKFTSALLVFAIGITPLMSTASNAAGQSGIGQAFQNTNSALLMTDLTAPATEQGANAATGIGADLLNVQYRNGYYQRRHYDDRRGYQNRRHYEKQRRHYQPHRGQRSNSRSPDLGSAVVGAIIGGIIVNEVNRNRQPQARVRSSNSLSQNHVNWCYDRWRSYRASDNSYQPYNGPRRLCTSPYGR